MPKLTNSRDVPFEICFKYPLEKGYTFDNLSQRNIKDFQRFLDKISSMTVDQVDHIHPRNVEITSRFLLVNTTPIYFRMPAAYIPPFLKHFHNCYIGPRALLHCFGIFQKRRINGCVYSFVVFSENMFLLKLQ